MTNQTQLSLPEILYSNESFLVFDEKHALDLRHKRVVGQLIGCAPKNPYQIVTSGLPYQVSYYAAAIVYKYGLASFKKLELGESIPQDQCEKKYLDNFLKLKEEAKREFDEKQFNELKKRDIEQSPSRLRQFDEKKMRISVPITPVSECSLFTAVPLSRFELDVMFNFQDHRLIVFRDLYDKGFYLSSGMKFGCDFLAYLGDPIRYHAQYAIRVVANVDGKVDLTKVDYKEINALHRLCHTAKKILLLAVVLHGSKHVNHWTLKPREYLSPESSEALESIVLKLDPV